MYLCKLTATGCNLRDQSKKLRLFVLYNVVEGNKTSPHYTSGIAIFSPQCFLQSSFDQRNPLQHLQHVSLAFSPSCSYLRPQLLLEAGMSS